MKLLERIVGGTCIVILLIVVVQSLRPATYTPVPPAPPAVVGDCVGTPISIDVPYVGATVDPWTCKAQCENDKARYILYSNGKATQCETPPGCNDTGEDTGIMCNPPSLKSTK
jgi:hypothetical protein